MPVFTPPIFNILANLWFCGNTPNSGPFDFENQECQLYIYSRALLDIEPGSPELWIPPVWLRMPTAAVANWTSTFIAEVEAGSGRYYLARWKDVLHLGFPNEYRVILMEQCDGDGVPTFRDVCPSISPGEHASSGSGFAGAELESSAFAQRNPSPGEHNATGTGEITIELEGSGTADQETTFHSATGSGDITADATGEGAAERH